MIINVKLKENKIIGYRTFPIDLNEEYIEIDEIPTDLLTSEYHCFNQKLYKQGFIEDEHQPKTNEPKYQKQDLLKAFEKYKNDVFYGEIQESKESHNQVLEWYKNMMNFDEFALSNPPVEIVKYLEGEK